MTPNITAIILAKNASQSLKQCLASVSWCEHVIVGDDGSSDDTIAVARERKADVIKIRASASFADKRNELLQYVQTDWVLFIDTDEVITPELRQVLESGSWKQSGAQGFLIQRMDVFMGQKLVHGETAHTWLVRLAKKDAGKWERAVHEVWNVSGKIDTLKGEIFHYSHPDLEEFIDKINHYTELEAMERMKNQELRSKKNRFSTLPLLLITTIQLFLYPVGKFLQNYLLRKGFLDQFPGFVMAYMMSLHSLCVRIKMLEKYRSK